MTLDLGGYRALQTGFVTMSMMAELRRRNIIKIAVAYLIVAWLLMQVAALAVPALFLPDWVTTFVVFILMLGFPVALLLAWAYEVTPDGIRKTTDVPLDKSVRSQTGQRINFIVIALLVLGIVFLLFERTGLSPTPEETDAAADDRISIAVLPFVNMSGDPEQEHFVDGLTEELLNSLAAIDELRVTSRTSSFSFKGQNLSLQEIAERLGVDHVLEGSVRRSGDRVRVTAQLIASDVDEHLWSEVYDRALTVDNIIDIQENVAMTVVAELEAQLRPEETDDFRVDRPANLEALDAYYDGRYIMRRFWNGELDVNDRAPFDQTVAAFERSIAADPNWAPAHHGLGSAHHLWRHFGGGQEDQFAIARQHIAEALLLDSDYAPAYSSLAYMAAMEGDSDAAFEAYERTASLGMESNTGLAILNFSLARYEESVAFHKKAVSADPVSMIGKGQLMFALLCAGMNRELADFAEDFLQVVPDDKFAKWSLAYAHARNGNAGKALTIANELATEDSSDLRVAMVLAIIGETDRARLAISGTTDLDWTARVPAAIVIGDTDLALDILEQVEAEAPANLQNLRCSSEIRSLAGNPRFDALMERLDLPE